MRIVVTGARGKVGGAAARRLHEAGHEVVASDLGRPVFERDLPDEPAYVQADLTDAGAAWDLLEGADVVVHAAAIPDPIHNARHVVFRNNLQSAYNVIEGVVRTGAHRLVNISSETVPGFVFDFDGVTPPYLPVDEDTPVHPHDAYAQAKWLAELLCDRAVERTDLSIVTIRPSWVSHSGNYERNLGPILREPFVPSGNYWSYTDLDDLAEAITLATTADVTGHEVCYVAQPDNCAGRPLEELVASLDEPRPEVRPLDRPDASGIDSRKAMRLLGWAPTRSWRDHLDEQGRAR